MTVDPEALRAVMRHWTTGVALLTSRAGAQAHGMTVNAFSSVSLEPPLVLVSVERAVRTHALIAASQVFALSILCDGQQEISDRFAGRDSEHADRFAGLQTFTAVTGAPIVTPNMGYLDCSVQAAHAHGTHTVFIAEVVAARMEDCETPLVYYNRDYRRLEK